MFNNEDEQEFHYLVAEFNRVAVISLLGDLRSRHQSKFEESWNFSRKDQKTIMLSNAAILRPLTRWESSCSRESFQPLRMSKRASSSFAPFALRLKTVSCK